MMKNTCKWWTNVHTFIFVSFSCHSIKSILSRQRFLIISIIYRSAFPSYPYIFGQSSIFLGPSILNQLIYQNLTYLWVTNLYLVPPKTLEPIHSSPTFAIQIFTAQSFLASIIFRYFQWASFFFSHPPPGPVPSSDPTDPKARIAARSPSLPFPLSGRP